MTIELKDAPLNSITEYDLGDEIEVESYGKGIIIGKCGGISFVASKLAPEEHSTTNNVSNVFCNCNGLKTLDGHSSEELATKFHHAFEVNSGAKGKLIKKAEQKPIEPKKNSDKEWTNLNDVPLGSVIEVKDSKHYKGGTVIAKGLGWITVGFEKQSGSQYWKTKGSEGHIGFNSDKPELLMDKKSLVEKYEYAYNLVNHTQVRVIDKEQPKKENLVSTLELGTEVEIPTFGTAYVIGKATNGDICLGRNDYDQPQYFIASESICYLGNDELIDTNKATRTKYKWQAWIDGKTKYTTIRGVPISKEVEVEISGVDVGAINKDGSIPITFNVQVPAIDYIDLSPYYLNLDNLKLPNDRQQKTEPKISIKNELNNAAYRVAGNQLIKGMKSSLLTMMEKSGHKNIKTLSELLDTEIGTAILSTLTGYVLTYSFKDDRISKLAEEFRVLGLSKIGNAAFDGFVQYLKPVLIDAISDKEVRVDVPVEVKENEIEETEQPKTANENLLV